MSTVTKKKKETKNHNTLNAGTFQEFLVERKTKTAI